MTEKEKNILKQKVRALTDKVIGETALHRFVRAANSELREEELEETAE